MKKLILPFLLVLFFVGCETESTDVDDQNYVLELNDLDRAPKDKVDICHITGDGTYEVININGNAVPAHLAHGDKFTYSPEGTYTIYRDNAANGGHPTPAILDITVFPDGTITGEGITAANVEVDYDGTWTVTGDTILMIIPQYRKDNGNYAGTHYIGGFISECDGIIEDLSDEHSPGTLYDYSFTEF